LNSIKNLILVGKADAEKKLKEYNELADLEMK